MSVSCQTLPDGALRRSSAFRMPLRVLDSGRHPCGFHILCLVVVCERWAAYTLASCLVLMLAQRYGYAHATALRLSGMVNAASYLGTLLGGLLADRRLGHRRALGLGTVLLALGYLALVSASPWALALALALLITGSALFKPSTQALLARLYAQRASRLDAAQVRLYMAINAGAAFGALVAGVLVRSCGWSAAFAVAALALALGRLALWLGQQALPGERPVHPSARFAVAALVDANPRANPRRRVLQIAALTLAMLIYTICYGQVEGSLLLWAQHRAERVVLGFEVPAAWFVALPAVLVLLLGRVQLAMLAPLQKRVGTHELVSAGLVATALAFLAMLRAVLASPDQRVGVGWLILCLMLLVVGELMVAPLGLGLVMRLAPPRLVGLVAGCWYIAGALGYFFAGEIGRLWARASGSPPAVLLSLVLLPLGGAVLVMLPVWRHSQGRQGANADSASWR